MAEGHYNAPVCQYFLNSNCRYGDKCHFSHRTSTPPRSSDGMCKFFLMGRCRFGDQCWNRHSSNVPHSHPVRNFERGQREPGRPFSQTQNRLHQAPLLPEPRWENVPKHAPTSSSRHKKVIRQLCEDYIDGKCFSGRRCPYIHGEKCGMCLKPCLNPYDDNQMKLHLESCLKELQQLRELTARQASAGKTCGICLDVVLEKTELVQRKFGILENCNHVFCFSCITKWRMVKNTSLDIDSFQEPDLGKACPECRVPSDFVACSKLWFGSQEDKKRLIADRKEYLKKQHCKAFRRGDGFCPHGSLCHNMHMLRNGQTVTLPPPSAYEPFRPREIDFMSRLLIMDFWDESEDFFSTDSEDDLGYGLIWEGNIGFA